ncbi:MAG: hypothetical protein HOK97_05660, partial [Deltaproteobacteria bacterium]|nr:hypothetical protein [Deltaproteobacteria bacterium]
LGSDKTNNRYNDVLEVFESSKETIKKLSEDHILEFYDLDGPISSDIIGTTPKGESTDLLAALENIQSYGGGRPLAGVLLISDGADNVELALAEEKEVDSQLKARLGSLKIPFNTAWPARQGTFKDISIQKVVADEFAFVHNTMEIQVTLEATGFEGATVPVSLKRGNELLTTEQVVLSDKASRVISFETKPDAVGEFIYTVEIPAFAGEAVPENNIHSFVVKVIRDKIRVLQVAGRPSWDERFLRQHLKENPNVDLISFFILRTPNDNPQVMDKELSLIPFPTNKIFDTELHTFDVVIFQNFDYRPFNMAHFLPNIREAVRKGLGFIMVGGPQSFDGGGYAGTAIDDILPIRMNSGGFQNGTFKAELTETGRFHPITELSRSSREAFWGTLPAFSTLNSTLGPAADSSVLLESVGSGFGQATPLLSVREVEDGRSMALMTDSIWRWRFENNRDGGAALRAYHRFWSGALRWLMRDPEHARIRVLPGKYRYEVGNPVEASIKVLNPNYQGAANTAVRVNLFRSNGTTVDVDDLVTGENGNTKISYDKLEPGPYRIVAEATLEDGKNMSGQGVFVVQAQHTELATARPRPDLLKAIAATTDAKSSPFSEDTWENLETVAPEVIEIDRRKNTELWDNGWALLLAVLLFSAEWALRRRTGYL